MEYYVIAAQTLQDPKKDYYLTHLQSSSVPYNGFTFSDSFLRAEKVNPSTNPRELYGQLVRDYGEFGQYSVDLTTMRIVKVTATVEEI